MARNAFLSPLHCCAPTERDLIDSGSGKEQFDREGVPKHMRVATLLRSIRPLDVGQLEKPGESTGPAALARFGIAVAAPEEISGIVARQGL
jgi:hypothetical protein